MEDYAFKVLDTHIKTTFKVASQQSWTPDQPMPDTPSQFTEQLLTMLKVYYLFL
jgi:hypothetical protein